MLIKMKTNFHILVDYMIRFTKSEAHNHFNDNKLRILFPECNEFAIYDTELLSNQYIVHSIMEAIPYEILENIQDSKPIYNNSEFMGFELVV